MNKPETKSTLLFHATLHPLAPQEPYLFLTLPRETSASLPSLGLTMAEGTLNGYPFRAALAPHSKGSHRLKLHKDLLDIAQATFGSTVAIEITRLGEEPETRAPLDLLQALAAAPKAQAAWATITPLARRDWILWIISAKQIQTRRGRIDKACDMLASGKRRVCCFGGLNWLAKNLPPSCQTWTPLPA